MARIHDRIRQILEQTPGLTQRGLAQAMNLNPAAVNRMLYGQRNIRADEIPVIESYLGVRLDLAPDPRARVGGPPLPAENTPRVPVYGYAAGSREIGAKGGLNLANGDIIDWAPRHPAQAGIRDAFAIYVFSDSMEPRYYRGELIYIHPGRPPDMNKDCVIEMKNGDAYIKRLVRQQGGKVRVQQFNPPGEKDIALDDIKAIYAVVGRG